MKAYKSLAGHYDSLTADVEYQKWMDFLFKLLELEGLTAESILDLACGTGTMCCMLAQRGFEVIGVDSSPEMLAVAFNKALGIENPPMFLNQDITRLDLYGTVDAAICSLDSVNYLTSPEKVQTMLKRLMHFINPGGLFVFDVLTEAYMESLDGRTFVDETPDVFCVWRADYERPVLSYGMDIFTKAGDGWIRSSEEHIERAYEPEDLKLWLEQADFQDVKFFGDKSLNPLSPDERRIFITARRKPYSL